MKTSFLFGAAAALVAATLVGCDWGGVSSEESWNDAYAWANFSGTYKLVTEVIPEVEDDDKEDESSDNDNGDSSVSYSLKQHKNGPFNVDGKRSVSHDMVPLGETVDGNRVDPGSVTVVVKTKVLTLDSTNNTTYEEGEITFKDKKDKSWYSTEETDDRLTIDYSGGTITVTLASSTLISSVEYTYSYYVKTTSGGSSVNNGGNSESNEATSVQQSPITWLNVTQKGNLLTLQDNDGRTYSGKITGASCPDADAGGYVVAGHIRFSFEATCTANSAITISGSLSGDWSGAQNETSGIINNRTMDASFSNGGSPTQFQAVSGSVTVVARTVTPVAGETN